ncbi:MAG: tripartite tricarboxylate transporter substrate-binding protein [Acetobacteraceae bacterium]|nr:tripartite tricarboxylate transporter substrate-binding protein [Acetobacteraceae bacterium]
MISRRRVLVGGVALAAASRHAAATEPVTLLVGAPADTPADAICRTFAQFLGRQLGDTEVAVRNVPGEAGLNVLNALADAPPTGATLGWISAPALPARMVDRSADTLLSRLTLIGAVEREPIAFVSPVATPLDSVQEIIRRSGEDADSVPLGTPPAGSAPHLAALRLQLLAQTRLNIVTFPSSDAALQAVTDGNVAAAALGLSDAIAGLREGKLAGVGIAAKARADMLPDLPVLNEAGVPLSATIRRGLAVPAGVPEPVVARFAAALKAISEDQDFRDQADSTGFLVVWIDGASWAAQMEAERADLAKLWASEPWLNSNGG